MIVCKFALPVFDLPEMARAYEYATGIEASVEELLLVGERITNSKGCSMSARALNAKTITYQRR